jgi:hypothetical protein
MQTAFLQRVRIGFAVGPCAWLDPAAGAVSHLQDLAAPGLPGASKATCSSIQARAVQAALCSNSVVCSAYSVLTSVPAQPKVRDPAACTMTRRRALWSQTPGHLLLLADEPTHALDGAAAL